MNRTQLVACFVLVAAALALTGCGGDTHESVYNDAMDVQEQILDAIIDAENVDDAKPKLEAAAKKIEKIVERAKALPEISKEDTEKIEKSMEPRLKTLKEKGMKAGMKMATKPEMMKAFQKAMMDLSAAMKK